MSQLPVDQLRALIGDAQRIVIFTGAGISTESGIPDFRSPGGIWTRYKPIMFNDFMASRESRRETWRRKIETDKTMTVAKPNRGHLAVAALVNRGLCTAVITQNIDGLHQASGVPAEQVIELHGNSTYAKCLDCGTRMEIPPILEAFGRDETMPECSSCGSEYVKTATISFGQSMPEAEMRRAEIATNNCDLMIAIGSSLQVYPAAGFPILAKRVGAKLAILNREATELDQYADLVVNDEIGPTLGAAVGLN
jgi:NAD-dependent deacetylase